MCSIIIVRGTINKEQRRIKEMTFEQVLAQELIKAYVNEYGADAWNGKSDEEKSATLHELLGSFLTVAKRH